MARPMSERKLIYVAGYGRSGSTMLGIVLGHHPDVACIGEATFALDDWDTPGRHCSCGASYRDCTFWGELLDGVRPSRTWVTALRRLDSQILSYLCGREPGSAWERAAYAEFHRQLFEHVRTRTGKPVVLDLSKSARAAAGRFAALATLADENVYVLHLVRSGHDTMRSLVKTGSNWMLEGHGRERRFPAVRAGIGWVRANVRAAALARRLGPDRYLRLRYEDFIADPAQTLRKIGRFVGFDAEGLVEVARSGQSIPVGHLIGGNRVRLSARVTLAAPVHRPTEVDLDARDRLFFGLVGGWLQRRYGYHD